MHTTSARHRPPRFSSSSATQLALDLYGITAEASTLPSERDQNFLLRTADGSRFVLKLAQAGESRALLEAQHAVLQRLADQLDPFRVPRVVRARNGEQLIEVSDDAGSEHWLRVVEYLPGKPLAEVRPHLPMLLREVGVLLGRVDRVLFDFTQPALERQLYWDVRHAGTVIAERIGALRGERSKRVESILTELDAATPLFRGLRTSVIHNDANDYNLIVEGPNIADPIEPLRLSGLIDFGDLVHTWTIAEVAIAAAYAMLGKADPLAAAAAVVGGYHSEFAIPEHEIAAIYPLIRARLAMSATIAAAQRRARPENEYLSISEAAVWLLLEQLDGVQNNQAHYRFRQACGLEPCPASNRVVHWLKQHTAAPVLPDHDISTARVFDFSGGSLEFGELAGSSDAHAWTRAVFGALESSNTTVGIGRYDEPRPWYTAPAFHSPSDGEPDWRTIHLGIDLFAVPGTTIAAPFDGVVYSVCNNAGHLDYGPTIILQHDADGVSFYTLYGHLSLESLSMVQPGARVRAGEPIATLGDENVNGGWSPHLHFQIVVDLLGRTGEFPGVARPSERALWLSVSPDPNLILRVPGLEPAPRAPRVELLSERRERIGRSLSIAYRKPLIIVRGWKQHLYDDAGQPYLDAVNNVAHVGHSHPHVLDALRRQAAVLNTNTRYLHENLTRYAERLTATLPAELSVCYFVCSGSEANELALRLARAHTAAHDVIVIDGAYHGNTSTLIELSPYKFNGAGGAGRQPYVQVVPLPDAYRGPHRGVDCGADYARHVSSAIDRIHERGQRVAAFFAESLPGCGGQIVPPEGYLASAFALVRAAGGVCVADEVQTGLGRVGSHFWAFETQAAVPDIVTVGKPIGNGHPLGAVITTPEIAASFNNGMEYFNTFGGNPVSCAVGMAVLDVIEAEGLQRNALNVGAHLLDGLQRLMHRHRIVGDVRGRGLYIGVELVEDRELRSPAGTAASYVANRMRDRGILLSTDGPDHNVLKIKPPMVFTEADADRLVVVLDEVLGDTVLSV